MNSVAQTRPELHHEWTARHGGRQERVYVFDNFKHAWIGQTEWLLPDGARMTNTGFGPKYQEPPGDPGSYARLVAIKRYHETVLSRLDRHIKALDLALRGFEAFQWPEDLYGPADHNGHASLARLQALANQEREAIANLDQAIAATPKGAAKAQAARNLAAYGITAHPDCTSY